MCEQDSSIEDDFNIADDLDYGCEDVDADGVGFQF